MIRQTETHFFVEVLGSVQFACLVEPMQCARPSFAPPRRVPHTEERQSGATTPEEDQPIGLPGVPFTFALSESPWTPERSWLYPVRELQARV